MLEDVITRCACERFDPLVSVLNISHPIHKRAEKT